MRRGILQPATASVSIDDDDDDNDDDEQCASYQSTNVYDNDEQGKTSSQTNQEVSSQEDYESVNGDSDCSATSAGGNHGLHEGPASYLDQQATNLSTLQADDSATTTWTDEKHSSYLDSMEATFVQKMYNKEYCSVDVCGHSSHSCVTLDQECVESQPFCLNMRKPCEQRVAGLLTSRASARPLSLVSSMWASPWIQHFQSPKQNPSAKIVSPKKAEFQDEGASTKYTFKTISVVPNNGSKEEGSPQSSHNSTHRKHKSISSFADHKYAAMNVKGYTVTSVAAVNKIGEYKKHKSQHPTLSHMDILIEKQFNSEQPANVGANAGIEDGTEDLNEPRANHCEHGEANKFHDNTITEKIRAMKEKQDLVGKPLHKVDQVPSMKGEEASGKNLSLEKREEHVLCTHSTDPEVVTTRSCTKTWTWGTEGPRYQLVGKSATPSSQGS